MANNFNLITKYLPEALDKVFASESKTALLENGGKWVDLNFKEAGYVKVANLLMDGLSDYYRVNHVGVANSLDYAHDNQNNGADYRDGYARGNAQLTWEIFKLQYDRGKQFLVDRMDDEETAGILLANLLTEFLRTRVVPEVDAVRFAKIAGKANATLGNLVVETTAGLTDANIISAWNAGFAWLAEHEVPEEEQVIFVNPQVYALVKNSSQLTRFITQEDYRSEKGITFKLPAYEGRPIIEVPSARFYTDVVVGANGYLPSANSKAINYMVCSKKAIVPVVKLNFTKVFGPEVVQDFDGYKVNIRLYHDAIIPQNKVVGCYVSISDASATTRTAKLELAMRAGSVQNAYAIDAVYTLPAGLLGKVVASASAITLGATITVDGTTIFNVNTDGTDNVDATNTALYFAMIDANNKVIAISGSITLVKHA